VAGTVDAGVAAPRPAPDAGAAMIAPVPVRAVDAGVIVPVAPVAPTHPVVVPPNAVRRTSGELPRIKTVIRPGQKAPTAVTAKVCIDSSGRVTSVVIYKLSGDIADALAEAIRTWRYSAYRTGGVAVPACFVNGFALK